MRKVGLGVHAERNRAIATLLTQLGYMSAIGTGVARLIIRCRQSTSWPRRRSPPKRGHPLGAISNRPSPTGALASLSLPYPGRGEWLQVDTLRNISYAIN